MRKLLVFLCCILLLAGMAVAQTTYNCRIPFVKTSANVIKVPVSIDTLHEQFIFDPGASVISFGKSFFDRLAAVNAISASDFLYKTKTMQANGQLADVSVYQVKFLAMGSMAFSNLEAMVIENNNAPLLLGQNLVKKFDSYTINNSNSTIDIIIRRDSFLAVEMLKIVPCDSTLSPDAVLLKKKISASADFAARNIDMETVFPINPNALKKIRSRITIRFFSRNDIFFARELKNTVIRSGYTEQDILMEDMTPFFSKAIPGYMEIWMKQ